MNGYGKPLVIRADANARIGTGHLMRCLALAQAWADAGGQVIFITACSNEQLLRHLYDEDFVVHRLERPYSDAEDWRVTEHLLSEHPKTWLVLDGYHFDSEYQRQVKEAGYQLMVIDDMAHLPYYHADILLNQNIHAKDLRYSCEPYRKLLLGTKYVLLRREFLKRRGWKQDISEVTARLLVTLGGGDAENVTLKVIQALQQLDISNLEAKIVVGPANLHLETLRKAVADSTSELQLLPAVVDMSELMAWTDVAISSGGTTCWELAFMGVPSALVVVADNQRKTVAELEAANAAVSLGTAGDLDRKSLVLALQELLRDSDRRRLLTEQSRLLVDGYGTERVVSAIVRDE